MGKRIVEQAIKRMIPPAQGNRIEWDSEVPGFGVRITAAGVVSFVLDYRIFGRQRRYTMGRWPELTATAARSEALRLRGDIRDGTDPMERRIGLRNEPLFDDVIDEYLSSGEYAKKRFSTRKDYKRMLDKKIRPSLGKLRVKAVTKDDIEKLHASLIDTPYAANRTLALISILFHFAIEKEWTTSNPARKVKHFPEDKRGRYLTKDELEAFNNALNEYHNQDAANALRLLLFTGARLGEVLKAEWSQFDLDRGMWVKPSHHVKQKKQEHTPLNEAAIVLLTAMRPENARGPLFIGKDGKKPRVTIRRPWTQALKAAGLVDVEAKPGKRRHKIHVYHPLIRIHDLRHNFVSWLILNGVPLKVAGKLVGHTRAATTDRYADLLDSDLRDATNKLRNIIPSGKPV